MAAQTPRARWRVPRMAWSVGEAEIVDPVAEVEKGRTTAGKRPAQFGFAHEGVQLHPAEARSRLLVRGARPVL